MLRIDGEAAGPIAGFLRYINESPVAARIGQIITRMPRPWAAAGFALKIGLPLGQPEDVKVVGEFAFYGMAELRIAGVPSLTKLSGKLSFTGARCPRA